MLKEAASTKGDKRAVNRETVKIRTSMLLEHKIRSKGKCRSSERMRSH